MPTIDELDAVSRMIAEITFELATPEVKTEVMALCLMRRQTAALERIATLMELR